jgi:hypothetical protein
MLVILPNRFKLWKHPRLRVSPRKQVWHLLNGQMTQNHFQALPFHLVISQSFARQNQTHFHLFNIALNVLLVILISLVAIVLIPILIPFIHLTISHLNHFNHTLAQKHILTLTGNLTPGFPTSAAP